MWPKWLTIFPPLSRVLCLDFWEQWLLQGSYVSFNEICKLVSRLDGSISFNDLIARREIQFVIYFGVHKISHHIHLHIFPNKATRRKLPIQESLKSSCGQRVQKDVGQVPLIFTLLQKSGRKLTHNMVSIILKGPPPFIHMNINVRKLVG